ncbi:DUF6000 family protein [Streptomyces bungoensis]|uniref:DUF6000 family protein n=1 Tax=Streptomyces bungoensis TaxID=285568 RepID=UPI003F4D5606
MDDAGTIAEAELEALLGYEWRSRLAADWLIGVGRRATFREHIDYLLPTSEFCFSGSAYCFALAHFGTHVDAEILTAYLDRYDQPAALGALLHLNAHHVDHFTRREGPWDQRDRIPVRFHRRLVR